MKIGNINIKNRVVLAPMAGFSNPAYMKICEEMGVSYAVTELLSAVAIVHQSKKTLEMLNGIEELKIPVAVQLFGSDPVVMAEAAKIIVSKYKNVFIDINMGCPVPKVAIKGKAGSALLKDPGKVFEIVSAVANAVKTPVTVKIRSGWDENSINAVQIAKVIEEAGAAAICVHARTRSQGYSGKADWNIIKDVKDNVSIPVIGNGDIKICYDAEDMLTKTGCDFVMVGRGLLGNPFLIKEIVTYLNDGVVLDKASNKEKIDMCLKHFDYLLKYEKENQAVLEMRTLIAWYVKGMPGGKEIKREVFKLKNVGDIKKILLDFKKVC